MHTNTEEQYIFPACRHYTEWRRMPKLYVVRQKKKWAYYVVNGFAEIVIESGFIYDNWNTAKQVALDSRLFWYKKNNE